MADSGQRSREPRGGQPGRLTRLLTLPFRLIGMLCGSLLLSILVECVGMHFFWPQERWHHAQHMLEYELNQLSVYFTESLIVEEPGRSAHALIKWTYTNAFVNTGLIDGIQSARARSYTEAGSQKGFNRLLGLAYVQIEAYLLAACYTALTFLVRLLVLTLTMPLFVTATFVGLVDGLVRRDIRRFGAGRESGFIYHRAKAAIVPIALLPWVAYLALPVSVHPLAILLPAAVLLGFAVNITAGAFKKYL